MPGLSRHGYDEFQQDREPIRLSQAEFVRADLIPAEGYLLNIANGQCLYADRVSCWLSPEGVDGGRRWGKLGALDAAIIPFRTKATMASDIAKLDTFELELFLSESNPEAIDRARFPEPCHNHQCRSHSAIRLVNLPAPENLAQCSTETSTSNAHANRPWRFRSEEIQNCDGFSRAAKWKWDANGHEPVVLHGGMAFQHLGVPLRVACRVRGKASIQMPNQLPPLRFEFGNEQNGPKWWTLVPQDSGEDLSESVRNLEAIVQSLNKEPSRSPAAPSVLGANPPRPPHSSQSHSFGASTISGPANVVMGGVHILHTPNTFRQAAGLPPSDLRLDPPLGTGILSHMMEFKDGD